jgi:hypothetical protein
MPPICPRRVRALKKSTGLYSAKRAALGGRTLKSGQTQWFVGYKKHTFRLWISRYERGVLLVPLVSWAAPANVSEGGMLIPSLRYCARRWSWWPSHVVADMGYLAAEAKRLCRENWRVTVLTHVRENMKMVPPLESETQAVCHQGQPLEWLGYDWRLDEHEFGPVAPASLCAICWEQSQCGRRFAYPPSDHESLLGLLPLCTRTAQRILQRMRPWIEPTQSYEKNQLGLSQVFLNSLRLTWSMCLLADAISIMRARAILERPPVDFPLKALLPEQLSWDWA